MCNAFPQAHANVSDVFFQRRWSVLRSVDDMVERIVRQLDAAGALASTYIVYTGDHGFHLGEFGMLYDKVRGSGPAVGKSRQGESL